MSAQIQGLLTWYCTLLCILLLSGCAHVNKQQYLLGSTWREIEARLYDIVLPVGCIPVQAHHNDNAIYLEYRINQNIDDLMILYKNEMERLGWWMLTESTLGEPLLVFEKPSSLCTVSFRSHETFMHVVVSIQQKKIADAYKLLD